jgi:hypothetical protein
MGSPARPKLDGVVSYTLEKPSKSWCFEYTTYPPGRDLLRLEDLRPARQIGVVQRVVSWQSRRRHVRDKLLDLFSHDLDKRFDG